MIKLRFFTSALALIGLMATAACDDFVSVTDPNVVDAGAIDPDADGPVLAWSAYQDFVSGYGDIILNTSWFTTDSWTGDSAEDRSEFGRRAIDPGNSRLNNDMWTRFARGLTTSENTVEILQAASDANSNIHLARVSLAAGYSYLTMAEAFCQGTARGGPPLNQTEMLNLAIDRLTDARSVGTAASSAEGTSIANAAAVGLGRAHLQAGNQSAAVSAVNGVPSDFEFMLYNADDPANRERLGNKFWEATADRPSLVVTPRHRALADAGDPRIGYVDMGSTAYDGLLRMYAQEKYTSWSAPYRLASGLEARYIAAEASGDPAVMLNLVNERRLANGHAGVDLSGAELLDEFLTQKSLDFWLEGQRMGDFRRHGTSLPDVLQSGTEFYKPAGGPVGDDLCFPLPIAETSANPNF